ncbi:MAG: (Na+)-NQR maturation NqrM [Psychromonas sp.]|nr:(Na+)-NQR maturation NqrM [Psychromonas sp.]
MEFVISFIVFLFVILMMATGVIFSRKKLKGSCGGLASVGIEKSCDCETVCESESRLYQIKEPNNE